MINSVVVDIMSISVLSLGDGSSLSLSVASSASTSASAAPTGMVMAVVCLVVVAVVVMVVVVDVFVAAMMVAMVAFMVVAVVATMMVIAVVTMVDCVVAATTAPATSATATATITFLCGGIVFCCYSFSVSGCIGFFVRFIFRSVSIFCLVVFSFFTSGSWCVGGWTVATGIGFWCFVFCRILVSGVFVSDVTDQVTRERSVPPLLWRR